MIETKDWISEDYKLVEATMDQLQTAMEAGRLSSLQLVMMYMKRIAAYDKQGISINAVLEINPDALHIAEALDEERRTKGPRGPLHGIPLLLKDNIGTGDHMHTSAGSLALENSYAGEDAFLVKLLRQAGAVVLGKTNMTEWANFMAENMPMGYSSRGGQVLNPYGPGTYAVGGSSAGSGAAIAANFAVAAVGTETSGSILSPASKNSLVGIKPTLGLISRSGIIPLSHSQDTAGPMARTVRDAVILLGALIGVDERDPSTGIPGDRSYEDYTSFLNRDGLVGARLGVCRDYMDTLSEEELTIMNEAIQAVREAGATVIDPVQIPTYKLEWDYNVYFHEFKSDLNAYLRKLAPEVPIHSLKELIEFNHQHAEKALRYGQAHLIRSEQTSGTLTDPAYLESKIKDIIQTRDHGIDALMEEYQLDALIMPANWGADIPAKAGYPSVTVPAGYAADEGPIGITFSGKAFSEPILIRLAYAYEQMTKHRVPPRLEGN